MKNKYEDMTSDELLNEIREASIENLDVNTEKKVDNIDKDVGEEDYTESEKQTLDQFKKFSKMIKKQHKLENKLKEIEILGKDNEELQQYISILNKLNECVQEIDKLKKEDMYEAANANPTLTLEDDVIKIKLTKPYEKCDIDRTKFLEDYDENSDMYKKYTVKKLVKGHITYKDKLC